MAVDICLQVDMLACFMGEDFLPIFAPTFSIQDPQQRQQVQRDNAETKLKPKLEKLNEKLVSMRAWA